MKLKHLAAAAVFILAGCGREAVQLVAVEPGSDTPCALDGMVLKDYPGPKAQIHYKEGRPEFFCDLLEMFATVFAPEQKRLRTALFVQDMGRTAWDKPEGHWIDANKAFYVVGSGKKGSMGPTFGSFSHLEDAQAFAGKEGGRVVKFDQITVDMVRQGAPHDHKLH